MESYEITYIVRPDLDEEQIRGVVDGVTNRLTSSNGEIIATFPWNPARRRLAYAINDFADGFYVTTTFRFAPDGLKELERALRLNDNLLRFLIVQATDLSIQQSQQRAQQAVARAAAAAEQQNAPPQGAPPAAPTQAAPTPAPAPAEETPVAAPATPEVETVPVGPESSPEASAPAVDVQPETEPQPAATVEE